MTDRKCNVFYVDHSGHPAPLSVSYHATASRELSSSLSLIPPSTVTEIDTAYCPQCLYYASYASATASTSTSTKGTCPNPQCRACPICTTPLNIQIMENSSSNRSNSSINANQTIAVYSCSYCRWNSQECDVHVLVSRPKSKSATDSSSGNTVDNSVAAMEKMIAQDLADALQIKIDTMEMESSVNSAFQNLLSQWGKRAQDEERRRRYGDGHGMTSSQSGTKLKSTYGTDGHDGWSIESLEKETQQKKIQIHSDLLSSVLEVPTPTQQQQQQQQRKRKETHSKKTSTKNTTTIPLLTPLSNEIVSQGIQYAGHIISNRDLLPLRIRLRPKNSRRCRAEINKGRPGILVRPKTNPLEGDSSLRSGHGQWWKKDSSAIHIMPKVQICQVVSSSQSTTKHALLLKVSNPTLSAVNLRFHALPHDTDNDDNNDGTSISRTDQNSPQFKTVLKSFLMDHISKTAVNAALLDKHLKHSTSSSSQAQSTEMIHLDAVEDAFLELGKGRNKDPEQIKKWNGTEILQKWDDSSSSFDLKILTSHNDVAWVQLLLVDDVINSGTEAVDEITVNEQIVPCSYRATYITMDIEVGNGSWESSFIKRDPNVPQEQPDLVPFQLVLVWNMVVTN